MKIVYLGNISSVAEALAREDGVRLVACIYEDEVDAEAMLRLSQRLGCELFRVKSAEDLLVALEEIQPCDLGVIANFGIVLGESHLALARNGFVNAHPGFLPENAGRFPVRRTLEKGECLTALTLHRVTPQVDAGPFIARAITTVAPSDKHDTLLNRIFGLAPHLIIECIRQIRSPQRAQVISK